MGRNLGDHGGDVKLNGRRTTRPGGDCGQWAAAWLGAATVSDVSAGKERVWRSGLAGGMKSEVKRQIPR